MKIEMLDEMIAEIAESQFQGYSVCKDKSKSAMRDAINEILEKP